MTAIRRPPLVPLIPGNSADLFVSFGISGNPIIGASIIGYNSTTMTPVVAFVEQNTLPSVTFPIATFAANPLSQLLTGRSPSTFDTFVYRFDGRKVRNAEGASTAIVFLNAYFNGRALIKTSAAFSTITPTTLVANSGDVTFANGTGFTAANVSAAVSDRTGNVAGIVSGKLVYWSASGSVVWNVPTIFATLEFGPSGNIYLAGGSTLEQINPTNGATNWTVTLPFALSKLFVSTSETIYVSGNATGATPTPFVAAYNASGTQLWQTNLWGTQTHTSGQLGGMCVVGSRVFVGMKPTGQTNVPPPQLTNLASLDAISGGSISYFQIGPVSASDWPAWLEPRAGRPGTFNA
jgi:hypothetical protein